MTAAIAAEALGAENIIGISLPSAISSEHSKDDAADLASNLGIEYSTLAIQSIVDAAAGELEPLFAGLAADVTEENLQARARGLLLMAVSNKLGALLANHGQQERAGGGLLHPVRRHVRRARRDIRRSQDAGVRSRPPHEP